MATLQQGYLFDDRYQLLQKLGEGGYAEVWLVEDTKAQLTLVLKIFLPEAELDDAAVELFRKEFSLVYNLNHPNLLKYSFFDICVGYPYLVMPYYSKGSAESLLGRCNEQMAWQYLRDVASGLTCLHGHHPAIIHQDIKPANVLLDENGFIITDFGISASVHSLFIFSDANQRSVKGTRAYMPPEKFLDNPQILVKNDIWSLGASLYELITGQLPFGRQGGETQLKGAEIPFLPSHFSQNLQYVVRKCLSFNPSSRPTAKELEQFAEEQLNNRSYVISPTPSYFSSSGNTTFPKSYDNVYASGKKSSWDNGSQNKKRDLFPWLLAAICVVGVSVLAYLFVHIFSGQKELESKPSDVLVEEPVITPQSKTSKKVVRKKETERGVTEEEEDVAVDVFGEQHTNKTTFVSTLFGSDEDETDSE